MPCYAGIHRCFCVCYKQHYIEWCYRQGWGMGLTGRELVQHFFVTFNYYFFSHWLFSRINIWKTLHINPWNHWVLNIFFKWFQKKTSCISLHPKNMWSTLVETSGTLSRHILKFRAVFQYACHLCTVRPCSDASPQRPIIGLRGRNVCKFFHCLSSVVHLKRFKTS